jgi:lipopolysaccharide/colanic/teichoic acid biosynthesis glycosyltransferase
MKAGSKRLFDVVMSFTGLLLLAPVMLVCLAVAAADTRSSGLFVQGRIGRYGTIFRIFKLRTMRDGHISRTGAFLRRSKLDELPQLINVLKGDMSIVGPRPDIPGYYDRLEGDDRAILALRPGITGPASLKYADEETLLARQPDPLRYNDEVIFPDKVRINRAYLQNQSLLLDVKIIIYTIFGKKSGW